MVQAIIPDLPSTQRRKGAEKQFASALLRLSVSNGCFEISSQLQSFQDLQCGIVHHTQDQLRANPQHKHQRNSGQDNQSLANGQIGEKLSLLPQWSAPNAL